MTPAQISDLLVRVEGAKAASREIDGAICKLVEPAVWARCRYLASLPSGAPEAAIEKDAPGYAPNFTASVDAALALVERVLPGSPGVNLFARAGTSSAGVWANDDDEHRAAGKTPALAILAALLRALLAQEGQP